MCICVYGVSKVFPGIASCDFLLWGYIKGNVCIPPPPPTHTHFLKLGILDVITSVPPDMLHKISEKLDYLSDVCCITRGLRA